MKCRIESYSTERKSLNCLSPKAAVSYI